MSFEVPHLYSELQRKQRVAKAYHVFRRSHGSFSSLEEHRHFDLTIAFRKNIFDAAALEFQAKQNEGSEE